MLTAGAACRAANRDLQPGIVCMAATTACCTVVNAGRCEAGTGSSGSGDWPCEGIPTLANFPSSLLFQSAQPHCTPPDRRRRQEPGVDRAAAARAGRAGVGVHASRGGLRLGAAGQAWCCTCCTVTHRAGHVKWWLHASTGVPTCSKQQCANAWRHAGRDGHVQCASKQQNLRRWAQPLDQVRRRTSRVLEFVLLMRTRRQTAW